MLSMWRNTLAIGAASKVCRLAGAQSLQPVLACTLPVWQQSRGTKHYNPKFRKLRGRKMIKIELPDFNEATDSSNLTPDEIRRKLKERGILPPRPWQERSVNISCTGGVFEEFVPPEGDGKVSIVTTTGAKQRLRVLEKKGKSMMSTRKIRSYDEEFDVGEFAEQALEIYRVAHEALVTKDKAILHANATELAYPKMMQNVRCKTLRWQLLRQLEPTRVVHVRHTDIISKENVYAQVTVRLHTQQLLAIYDRFGRLMYGSEVVAKDVLEYVVFEKHLANEYGRWRIHDKIVPDWMPARDPIAKTWRVRPVEAAPADQAPADQAPADQADAHRPAEAQAAS